MMTTSYCRLEEDEHLPEAVIQESQTLSKAERKKHVSTIKPMSAAEERTLNTAVAMAHEMTSKSMNDLKGDKKLQSPNEKSNFFFKCPRSLHHESAQGTGERDQNTAAREPRRNFSDEARNLPDLQSTFTEESKMAYTSLIEEPTPSTSLMSHIAQESSGGMKPANTIPKPARMTTYAQFHSLHNPQITPRVYVVEPTHEEVSFNILPLPPRTGKLVDKPRHIRRHPLKLLDKPMPLLMHPEVNNIYQNTKKPEKKEELLALTDDTAEDVVDLVNIMDTNPFNIGVEPLINPFGDFFAKEDVGVQVNIDSSDSSDNESNKALGKERKEHVSVEDLLEFADQKPCGRQRGAESDEVRIMCKVLKEKANQAQCLEALELSGWNVHNAIKLLRVKISVGTDVTFNKCHEQLQETNGDIAKAISMLVSSE